MILKAPAIALYYASQIAEENEVPVILVGGLRSPEIIEDLLDKTKIDYFALCRPLMAEPDLVRRWQNGDRDKSSCLSCNRCFSPEGNLCLFIRKQQAPTES
jgi:2,4-dienoyl-CoA reductase-like NADH-dependent reductase (Old Yellow Enzyme family)